MEDGTSWEAEGSVNVVAVVEGVVGLVGNAQAQVQRVMGNGLFSRSRNRYTCGMMCHAATLPPSTPLPLLDSHLHLQDSAFAPDRAAVLQRAAEAGVRYMVCNGTCEADWAGVLELARGCPQIVPCFGLHPWFVGERSAEWAGNLERFLDAVPSGVGEMGLDRWIEPRDEAGQEEVFIRQLEMAQQRERPVMVHCLRAWGWLMEVLRREAELPQGMLLHAYGGAVEMVGELAAMGAYFSFAGNVLEPRRERARASLAAVPADRLLLETDAPDMLGPREFCPAGQTGPDGKPRNEPGNLPGILRGVARVRRVSEAELAEQVWQNGRRFFGELIP